ncbi:efflux transporter outer membrane subunit [Sphingomonas sp. MMS24-J13]|uniref:efflux transporter outer membrane subunit n=1 Tax=Sphingomonas sp. MMS24-J13 TaxID=3238686 RepID=UPI00384D27FF
MARVRLAAGAALLAMLAGCSFAPPYRPPAIATPVAYKEAGPWIPAAPADLAMRGAWWAVFGDTTLDSLEQSVDRDNPTLAEALGRYDEARAYLVQAHAGLLPTIGFNTEISGNRQSDNRPLRGANQPNQYPADAIGASASYELDLWGRVRNSIAAGRADAEASADDLAAIRLSLEAELASSYIALRGYDLQIQLLSATVDAYAKADAMTERRFRGGIASGVDTGRSGAQLAEAQAQLADIRAARALTEHAIASLTSTPASSFAVQPAATGLPIPIVPASLPSALLQRRPDVAAAERRMAAANARIGVTKAAFFPAISLGGQVGVQNTGLPDLISAPNLFWSIGPNLVLNLFDGGRRRAQLAVARAEWNQSTAAYRRHVLQAFQDVEDNLARLHLYGVEAEAEDRAVTQAGQAEALSLNRYVKGAVDYLDVVTAQTTALRTRRQALILTTLRLQASVGLIRALGGGWINPDAQQAADRVPQAPNHSLRKSPHEGDRHA